MNTIRLSQIQSILIWFGLACVLLNCVSCYLPRESADSDAVYQDYPSISLTRAEQLLGGPAYFPVRLPQGIETTPKVLDHTDSLPLLGIYYFDLAGKPALRLWERPCHLAWPCWGEKPPTSPDGVAWRQMTTEDGVYVMVRIFSVEELRKFSDVDAATMEYSWNIRVVFGTDEKGTKIDLYSTLSLSDTLETVEALVPVP